MKEMYNLLLNNSFRGGIGNKPRLGKAQEKTVKFE